MPTREELRALALAEKCGAIRFGDRVIAEDYVLKDHVLHKFYMAAFEDGRKAALKRKKDKGDE